MLKHYSDSSLPLRHALEYPMGSSNQRAVGHAVF